MGIVKVGAATFAASLLIRFVALFWGFFLTLKILELIGASELMWFLFWGSVPLAILGAVLDKLVEGEK